MMDGDEYSLVIHDGERHATSSVVLEKLACVKSLPLVDAMNGWKNY
jgi:hypothetical protein